MAIRVERLAKAPERFSEASAALGGMSFAFQTYPTVLVSLEQS
jgi:hypothetical protein